MTRLIKFLVFALLTSQANFAISANAKSLAKASHLMAKASRTETQAKRKINKVIVRSEKQGCNINIASSKNMRGHKNEINFAARDINIICKR